MTDHRDAGRDESLDMLTWTSFWRMQDWVPSGPGGAGDRPAVLVVDPDAGLLDRLCGFLETQGMAVVAAQTLRAARSFLRSELLQAVVTEADVPDALLAATRDTGRGGGLTILREANHLEPPVPVVVLSARPRPTDWMAAIRHGAEAYLPKPVDPGLVAGEVRRALRKRNARPESIGFGEVTELLSDLVADGIERVDPYTAGHSQRARRYSKAIAEHMGLPPAQVRRLELAAVAHDYGKIFLHDKGFLTKRGPLTDSEYRAVKEHPTLGAERLSRHGCLRDVCSWIGEHHERWDGLGYPRGLSGKEISLGGRILCVAEVFDSLVTRRPYKRAWSLRKTRGFLEAQSGRAFDPKVLSCFLEVLDTHGQAWLATPQVDSARQPLARRASA